MEVCGWNMENSFLLNSLEDSGYFHKVLLVSTNVIYNLAHIFDIQHFLLSFHEKLM